jgi:hypothetical protein
MIKGNSFNNEVVDANARAVNAGGLSEAQDDANALYSRINGASFELVPSSYKESTVYAGTGVNGDLTFTRAGDAWRTNGEGLIQRVPWNLLRYSEQFDNAVWGKEGLTVSANTTTAPNGTTTVDILTEGSLGGQHRIYQGSPQSSNIYTLSVYVKNITGTRQAYIDLGLFKAFFNFASETTFSPTGISTFQNVGNGWYRFSVTSTSAITITTIYIGLGQSNSETYTGNGTSAIAFWGAQLVEGTTPQTYLPTTDRLNVPRLDYTYGSTPSLLLEPQRTNLSINSIWTNSGALPTSWTAGFSTGALAPVSSIKNKNVSAYRFVCSTQRSEFYQIFTITSGTVLCFSAYVESATTPVAVNQVLRVGPITGAGTFVFFKNGVLITAGTIVEAGFTYTKQLTCTSTGDFQFRIGAGVSSTVTADITLSMPQYEVGTFPTTFIPTSTVSVTRLVDTFSRNNIYTNGLISSSGGTWFIQFNNNISYTRDGTQRLGIGDNTSMSNDSIFFIPIPSLSKLQIYKSVGGTLTFVYETTSTTAKFVIKWNGTTADIFENGTKVVAATSFTPTNMGFLTNATTGVPVFIQQMALFPTPISDADCISLTADYTDGTSITNIYEQYVNNLGGTVENLNGVTNLIQNLK